MFGLFDRPCLKIAKHAPAWAREPIEECEHEIGARAANYGFTRTDFELAKGFALSAWILNEHRHGRIMLSNAQGSYISNLGTNCSMLLKGKSDLAIALVRQLEDEGVIEGP